ncbi:hypothetical protein B296_00053826 [Ensete ventricosum]|uniref:Uncharacterized protein n=1 Tax=Ensete ventricosum TaxID=4639 RepID=A0A426Y682_ENSVE|nr:hypothetical protein B296_00053826 [Ensete ventricosum]
MSNTTLPRAQTAIYNQSLNKRNIGRRPFRQPPSGHIRWPTSTRKLKSDLRPVTLFASARVSKEGGKVSVMDDVSRTAGAAVVHASRGDSVKVRGFLAREDSRGFGFREDTCAASVRVKSFTPLNVDLRSLILTYSINV